MGTNETEDITSGAEGNHGVGVNGTEPPTIIRRSDMGLAISGTRISINDVLDYLHDEWPNAAICDALTITEEQLQAALDYIETHRTEVEAEFAEMERATEERRRYHEERLREHLASLPPTPADPAKAAIYKKLADERGKLLREIMQEREREDGGRVPYRPQ